MVSTESNLVTWRICGVTSLSTGERSLTGALVTQRQQHHLKSPKPAWVSTHKVLCPAGSWLLLMNFVNLVSFRDYLRLLSFLYFPSLANNSLLFLEACLLPPGRNVSVRKKCFTTGAQGRLHRITSMFVCFTPLCNLLSRL